MAGSMTLVGLNVAYGQEIEGGQEADEPAAVEGTTSTQVEKDEGARKAYLRGRELFDQRAYDEAAEEFRQAYELSGRPILLLSIASAHERAGRFDLALRTLRDYRPFATPEDVNDVDFRIQSIEGRIQALEGNKEPAPAQNISAEPPPQKAQKSGFSTVGWVVTGLGVASAATGGVFYYLGEQKHREVADATSRNEAVDLVNSGDVKKTTGYIFMGVGAAAIIGGVTLIVLSSGGDEDEVALMVSPSTEGAVLTLSGRF